MSRPCSENDLDQDDVHPYVILRLSRELGFFGTPRTSNDSLVTAGSSSLSPSKRKLKLPNAVAAALQRFQRKRSDHRDPNEEGPSSGRQPYNSPGRGSRTTPRTEGVSPNPSPRLRSMTPQSANGGDAITTKDVVDWVAERGMPLPSKLIHIASLMQIQETVPSLVPRLLERLAAEATEGKPQRLQQLCSMLCPASVALGRAVVAPVLTRQLLEQIVTSPNITFSEVADAFAAFTFSRAVCGGEERLTSSSLWRFRVDLCRTVEKWDLNCALLVAFWAMDCVQARETTSTAFASPIHAQRDFASTVSSTLGRTASSSRVSDGKSGGVLGIDLPFPAEFPEPNITTSSILGCMTLAASELSQVLIGNLAQWCSQSMLRTEATGLMPVAIMQLLLRNPETISKVKVANHYLVQLILLSALRVACRVVFDVEDILSCELRCGVLLAVPAYLQLAIQCLHILKGRLIADDSQKVIAETIEVFARYYLAKTPRVKKCASKEGDVATAAAVPPAQPPIPTSPTAAAEQERAAVLAGLPSVLLRLAFRCADIVLHDYAAGPCNVLRIELQKGFGLLAQLEQEEVHMDLLETVLAAAGAEVPHGATLAGYIPCACDESEYLQKRSDLDAILRRQKEWAVARTIRNLLVAYTNSNSVTWGQVGVSDKQLAAQLPRPAGSPNKPSSGMPPGSFPRLWKLRMRPEPFSAATDTFPHVA